MAQAQTILEGLDIAGSLALAWWQENARLRIGVELSAQRSVDVPENQP